MCDFTGLALHGHSQSAQLMSGSGQGDVKLWDIRQAQEGALKVIQTGLADMSAMAAHPRVPVLAAGRYNLLVEKTAA